MAAIPNTRNITIATTNTPPHMVKSYLVWVANSVKAKQTRAVIPTARSTWRNWNNNDFYKYNNDRIKKKHLLRWVHIGLRKLPLKMILLVWTNRGKWNSSEFDDVHSHNKPCRSLLQAKLPTLPKRELDFYMQNFWWVHGIQIEPQNQKLQPIDPVSLKNY